MYDLKLRFPDSKSETKIQSWNVSNNKICFQESQHDELWIFLSNHHSSMTHKQSVCWSTENPQTTNEFYHNDWVSDSLTVDKKCYKEIVIKLRKNVWKRKITL